MMIPHISSFVAILCWMSGCSSKKEAEITVALKKLPEKKESLRTIVIRQAVLPTSQLSVDIRSREDSASALIREFHSLSLQFRKRVKNVYSEISKTSCPPTEIRLIDGSNIRYDLTRWFSRGSGSKLFRTTLPDDSRVVKFIEGKQRDPTRNEFHVKESTLLSLADEYALMKTLNGKKSVSPALYEIDPESIQPACFVRLLVTEFVGEYQIKTIKDIQDPKSRLKVTASVGAKALQILRDLHSLGFVHGDIHYKNFVFSGQSTEAGRTLRLIDFGRAEPYLDEGTGNHCPREQRSYGTHWTPYHLSPWELQGERKTRRDDIFRLAETLLRSGGYDDLFESDERVLSERTTQTASSSSEKIISFRNGVLALKENRRFRDDVPQILREFYSYSLQIGYADEPLYDTWIQRFNGNA